MAKLLQNNSNLNDLEYSRHLKVRKIEKKAKKRKPKDRKKDKCKQCKMKRLKVNTAKLCTEHEEKVIISDNINIALVQSIPIESPSKIRPGIEL